MNVLGYGIGEIQAEAAMTSDIVMRADLPFDAINDYVEIERRTMDVFAGMNRKYTPFSYDAASGDPLCGGRYVFDTWENVQAYYKWTIEQLEFEPGVKFWDRAIFSQVDRHIWKVVGAHDFSPVETHGVNRFERWRYTGDADQTHDLLQAAWPAMREEARARNLGTAWLLHQPEEKQIAILVTDRGEAGQSDAAALSAAVEKLALMASLGERLPSDIGIEKAFDRTAPVFSTWLPLSRVRRGAPVVNPSSPALPFPRVEPQQV